MQDLFITIATEMMEVSIVEPLVEKAIKVKFLYGKRESRLDDKQFLKKMLNQYRALNVVYAYWNVGRRIVKQEQYGEKKARYGAYLKRKLSIQLLDEFGTGFSVANLKNCRHFYLTFPEDSYGYSIAGKIPWSHLRSIMRISDEEERNFYLNEVVTENWSVRVLERNIKSGYDIVNC